MAATTQVRLLVWTQFSHARVHAAGWQQARVLRRANPLAQGLRATAATWRCAGCMFCANQSAPWSGAPLRCALAATCFLRCEKRAKKLVSRRFATVEVTAFHSGLFSHHCK